MGSLSFISPPQPATPPPSQKFAPSGYRIFASFCRREPTSSSNNTTWIEYFDPKTNTWSHVGLCPGLMGDYVLKGFSMVSQGDSLYIIGGRRCQKEMAHVSDELADLVDMDIEILSSVYRYDVRTDQWSECAQLITPRSDFACTVYDNKIYVAGGQLARSSARGIASAEVYDPNINQWTQLPNMNTSRYKCVGVVWQDKIHVVGGFAERLDSDKTLPSVTERSSADVYDPKTGTWELMAKMWQLDIPPNQIVEMDGRLFSSGDCLKKWKGHIEIYDAKENIWNEVERSCLKTLSCFISKSEVKQLYLTMAPIGTYLYFFSGYRIGCELAQTISMVCIFDTAVGTDTWRSFEPVEEVVEKELCSHCCVVQLL